MRNAFTLIELMIVIAIIAIIAAIAIPNLLESRITANEAAAAASLKSGLFPAQVQYQNGGYVDVDADGRGIYAAHPAYLAGTTGAGDALNVGPTRALSLLDPARFNNSTSTQNNPAVVTPATMTRAGAYDYGCAVDVTADAAGSTTHEDNAESFWAGYAVPARTDGSEGRRAFAITTAGTLYQSSSRLTQAQITMATLQTGGGQAMFNSDPISTIPTPNTANATAYQK